MEIARFSSVARCFRSSLYCKLLFSRLSFRICLTSVVCESCYFQGFVWSQTRSNPSCKIAREIDSWSCVFWPIYFDCFCFFSVDFCFLGFLLKVYGLFGVYECYQKVWEVIVIAGHGTVLSKVVWLLANIFRLFLFVCSKFVSCLVSMSMNTTSRCQK